MKPCFGVRAGDQRRVDAQELIQPLIQSGIRQASSQLKIIFEMPRLGAEQGGIEVRQIWRSRLKRWQ